MFGWDGNWCLHGCWAVYIIPMILIMGLCIFFMMSGMRRRNSGMMCWRPASQGSKGSIFISSTDSAKEILDKRYALGEISKEEYEGKKNDLT